MKTYLIFIIQAYESATDTGQLTDVVTIELIDTNCKSVLKRAEKLIKKKYYRISNIIEKEKNG
jgi:2C-methyl-D-erythritol 2,4-cyclodiphosphate synthase